MMLQATCRGYAVAQFMQPEPAKYAHVPTLAATWFMLPEQQYFAHHPGRFFYVRDDDGGVRFSAPFEPMRVGLDQFEFSPGQSDIRWLAEKDGLRLEVALSLAADEVVELWEVQLVNQSDRRRRVSLIPYFPVGFSSWMNMGAAYDEELQGIVATSVAPYQKVDDYFKRKQWKDWTYLLADRRPTSFEANQAAFEGEGGLADPDALDRFELGGGRACYEMPACILHFALQLEPGERQRVRLLFGPARDRAEIAEIRARLLQPEVFERTREEYARYVAQGAGCIEVSTPDETFDRFVNDWAARQVYYHGDTNRLTTDPQTRNYLQDAMGMVYVEPGRARHALLTALGQQAGSGKMPDGVLLTPEAELKYINQVPHTDHGVWVIICLDAYLAETNDWALLDEPVPFADAPPSSVFEHVERALRWLLDERDERGLSLIGQGDWCDPMNMVGHQGEGVSGWLSEAVAYVLRLWAAICQRRGLRQRGEQCLQQANEINQAIQRYLWDGAWFARGITDAGRTFGIASDEEGQIFLNAQSFALLSGAADAAQVDRVVHAVGERLMTPFGPELCAPAFTRMHEDIGRVTQKYPGTAENGSVYNHAAAFYAAALFHVRDADGAYEVLRRMLPGPEEAEVRQRGQLPVYLPNYYRGAYKQLPDVAGRSSHLFNTGTAAWYYRLVVEQLFGLRGDGDGLIIAPQLPKAWNEARAVRRFRGATVELQIRRVAELRSREVRVDGSLIADARIAPVETGRSYRVQVLEPTAGEQRVGA